MRRAAVVLVVVGASVSCDFGAALDDYCAETGQCPDGGSSSGGRSGGGSTAGGSTAGGSSAGGSTAGGSSAGGSSAGGSTAGGSSAGGSSAGGSAGGAFIAPPELALAWTPDAGLQGWILDLDGTPRCFAARVHAVLPDGGSYRFATLTPFQAVLRFVDGGAVPPDAASLAASCTTGGAPAFQANGSVADLAFRTERFGRYVMLGAVGGLVTASPVVNARPNGYFVFPRNGGASTPTDAGLCVEYRLTSQAWQSFPPGPGPRQTVAAATSASFSIDSAQIPSVNLVSDCDGGPRLGVVTMDAGAPSADFAIVYPSTAPATFVLTVRPLAGLGAGYGVSVERTANRFCTPTGTSPGNVCSTDSECCNPTPLCSTPNNAPIGPACL